MEILSCSGMVYASGDRAVRDGFPGRTGNGEINFRPD